MKIDSRLLSLFKDKSFISSLILSLIFHFFLFTLFPDKEDKLVGDKYIPIEILDIKSPIIKGDTINESKKNFSDREKKFQKKIKAKLDKNIEDKKINDFKVKQKNIDLGEPFLKKNTPQNRQLENENKKGGIEEGTNENSFESGSIQGEGFQKVTCLNCLEPNYPKLAIKKGYEGVLKLKILIQKNGLVKKVIIKESTGYKILDNAGVYAALNSSFYPLTKETNLNIEYTLKLN